VSNTIISKSKIDYVFVTLIFKVQNAKKILNFYFWNAKYINYDCKNLHLLTQDFVQYQFMFNSMIIVLNVIMILFKIVKVMN